VRQPFDSAVETELIQIYRETIRSLYRYVSRRVGGDAALAEDLVQDTWMRALVAWPARGTPDEPLAWLIRVARNRLVDHFRRIQPSLVDPTLLDLEVPARESATPDAAALVGWGLARIRRAHAEVLEAFYFDGLSVREIARDRRLSERAVEGRLRRARLKLKRVLERAAGSKAARRTTLVERKDET
jgi:RNA polymerase sigma-70 factor (ECF subfamily)